MGTFCGTYLPINIIIIRTQWWRVVCGYDRVAFGPEGGKKNTKCAEVNLGWVRGVRGRWRRVIRIGARLVAARAFSGKRGDEILLPRDDGGSRAEPSSSPRCQPHTNPTRGRHLPAGIRTSFIQILSCCAYQTDINILSIIIIIIIIKP